MGEGHVGAAGVESGTLTGIELNGGGVPGEGAPLHARIAFGEDFRSDAGEHLQAKALAAKFGQDKQVFKMNPALGCKGAEHGVIEGVCHSTPLQLANQYRSHTTLEKPIRKGVLSTRHILRTTFVGGQSLDEFENLRDIGSCGPADDEWFQNG